MMMDFRISLLVAFAVCVCIQCDDRTESQSSKVDSPVTAMDAEMGDDEQKRGHIFRYGRANVFRYGKRAPSVFRYGKRAPSVFRYGKRDVDGSEDLDSRLATLFPKRIFRYGKRVVDDDWNEDETDALQQQQLENVKRLVFRYGKRSVEDFGDEEEAEEDERNLVQVESNRKAEEEFVKTRDDKRPTFRYGRSVRLPNVPFRFGDE